MADAPDIDPVAAAARRDADLADIEAQLAGPSAHASEMGLPVALQDDGEC
jgi:hypothetical protein